jgi:hypothetical protein
MNQLGGFFRAQPRLSFTLDQFTHALLRFGRRTEINHILRRRSTGNEIDQLEINRIFIPLVPSA